MDWVGDVPEHWEVHRLKHIASVQFSSVDKHTKEDETPVRLCNYVDVYYNDFIKDGIDFMAATATRSEIDRFHLRHGDVLITKDSEAWDDIAVPAYVAEEFDGVLCGYHLAHIRPDLRKVLGEYLFRAFRSRGVNDQFRVAANGITRFGLGKYWLDNGLFPVPPLDEQKALAEFLDRETARIDALIEKKRRQIELLQEKRSALISHAVTKGLDPNAPMKDSGIEWLGKVPTHWDVLRLKRIACIGNGSTPSRENIEYWTNGSFPWLNSSVVNQVQVMEGSDFVTDLALRECHLPCLSPPTVVVGITGEGKTRGMATVVEIECTINQHLAFIKPKDGAANAAYVRNLFLPLYDFLRRESSGGGSTKGAITCEQLANLKIPCPPVHEQTEIVDRIDREASQTDTLLARVQRSIDLLREHRSALISAAVTGKIDVRGEVA